MNAKNVDSIQYIVVSDIVRSEPDYILVLCGYNTSWKYNKLQKFQIL